MKKPHSCDFCGKDRSEVSKLIVGHDSAICDECVTLCNKILLDQKGKDTKKTNTDRYNPVTMKHYLDQYIIGQEDAKIALCVAVSQHYKRISNMTTSVELDKSNAMIIGPTGCGKTLIAKKIAAYIDVPFAHADATTMTEAGYVGDDVNSVIFQLMEKSNWDPELASRGIVYIDEIDKISRRSDTSTVTRDISGEGVQHGLLKLLEGNSVRIVHPKTKDSYDVDTRNVLFMVGGSFPNIDSIVRKRTKGSTMGFNSSLSDVKKTNYHDVEFKDIISYGLIPEFMGRFSILTVVEELDKEDLVRILKEPKNNLTEQFDFIFQLDHIELELTDSAYDAIAQKALDNQTNARGLRQVLEKILIPYQFEAQELAKKGLKRIIINKEVITDYQLPLLVFEDRKMRENEQIQ
jgi:ATP-dependent Clp protease ATP-binding subunit ClpX